MLRSGDYRYSIWVAVGTREQVRESLVMLRRHAAWLPKEEADSSMKPDRKG